MMDKCSLHLLSAVAMLLALICAAPASAQGSIRYLYDEVGRLVGVADAAGQSAAYRYDAAGNIVSVSRHSQTHLAIINFAPYEGAAGDSVIIAGSGFGAVASENAVSFNGVNATVVSATSTQIVALVPAGASTGPIGVAAPAGSATTAEVFVVGSAPVPTISGFTPNMGSAGTVVAVTGSNYATEPGASTLRINGRLASAEVQNANSLAAIVSAGTSSGKMMVATAYGIASSADDFFVVPDNAAPSDIELTLRMVVGQSKTVTIAAAGKKGLILFDGSAGQRVSLLLSGVTISSGTVSLIAPGGATIATTSMASSGRFIDATTLPATGTYTILLNTSASSKGSVTLALNAIEPVISTIGAGGPAATVTAGVPGQNMELRFSGAAGQRVSLNMNAISATLGCPLVTIVKPDGTVLAAFSGYSCNASYFFDAFTLPLAGQYKVVIDPLKASTGSASFTLFAIPADTGTAIAAGGPAVTVTTSVPGENASVLFDGAAGQRISVNITAIASSLNCPSFSILKPDGSHLVAPSTSCSSSYFIDAATLPADGQYKVVMDPRLLNTGSATFALYAVPADVIADIVAGGPSVKLTTGVPGQGGALGFEGAAAQKISLNVTAIASSLGCSKFSIVKPDGSILVAPTTACGAAFFIDAATLPVAGTYKIVMDPAATGIGSATFTLYQVPESLGAIVVGAAPQPVVMSVPGQNMDLLFNGTAGQKVTVRITGNTVGCQTYSMRRPDASVQVSTMSCSANVNLAQQTLATAGSYLLRVDPSAAKTGSANVAVTSP